MASSQDLPSAESSQKIEDQMASSSFTNQTVSKSEESEQSPAIDELPIPLMDEVLLDPVPGLLPPLSTLRLEPNNRLILESLQPNPQLVEENAGVGDALMTMPPPPSSSQFSTNSPPAPAGSSQEGPRPQISKPKRKSDMKKAIPVPQVPLEAPPMERSGPPPVLPVGEGITIPHFRNLPAVNNVPYAFEYADAASFPEEIEEWFHYASEEFQILNMAANVFTLHWMQFTGEPIPQDGVVHKLDIGWATSSEEMRARFVVKLLARVDAGDETLKPEPPIDAQGNTKVDEARDGLTMHDALFALVYIMLGCWQETAGLTPEEDLPEVSSPSHDGENFQRGESVWQSKYGKSISHFDWIKSNTRQVLEYGGLEAIMKVTYPALDNGCSAYLPELSEERSQLRRKVWCSLTLMYIILEVVRVEEDAQIKAQNHDRIITLEPNLITTLFGTIDSFRWKDYVDLPKSKIFLLTWKAILVSLGGLSDVADVKKRFRDPLLDESDQRGQPVITASPLDYHQYRQEIGSKYPAYIPPPTLFPLEPDHRTILPPITTPLQSKFTAGSSNQLANHNGASILHQPVHIATPAPSPPPSPGPSGKGFKKQNYQTNQLFPLLYPMSEGKDIEFPLHFQGLDNSELQKEWKGDVPLSILEGTQLFVKRLYAPRAMKQMWEERESFLKFQRGWVGLDDSDPEGKKDRLKPFRSGTYYGGSKLKSRAGLNALEELGFGESLEKGRKVRTQHNKRAIEFDQMGEEGDEDDSPEKEHDPRLDMVEQLYQDNLTRWQSIVIVLLNVLHTNANTAFMLSSDSIPGFGEGCEGSGGAGHSGQELNQTTIDTVDAIRSQEISTKAVTGILILLLKWFKVSHILKFEYITQLLLDANFLPLVLRIIYTQDVEHLLQERFELNEFNFFSFCRRSCAAEPPAQQEDQQHPEQHDHQEQQPNVELTERSAEEQAADSSAVIEEDEFDDSCPPPIKIRRCDPDYGAVQELDQVQKLATSQLSDLEPEAITVFSWRSFFSFINFLRLMQKVCKKKAHRELLLVTYKSSQFLAKTLQINQREMQLYTLKLFKCQVPYCGRKWRQANMNVITAVYLHCRPELREDWLAGMDTDAELHMAVPNEQALRALTHWYNVRRYPEQMGLRRTAKKQQLLDDLGALEDGGGDPEVGLDANSGGDDGGVGPSRRGGHSHFTDQDADLFGPGGSGMLGTNKVRRVLESFASRSLEEEQDFFVRELERMKWEAGGEGIAFQEHQRWAEGFDEGGGAA